MIFLSTLIALGFVYWWGIGRALQRDEWFWRWVGLLKHRWVFAKSPTLVFATAVLVPSLVLGLLIATVVYFSSYFWILFIYIPVLIYSLGRGDLRGEVNHYLILSQRGDTVAAARWVDGLGENTSSDEPAVEVDDWQKLHSQALEVISYRNFERLFAVLFWFFLLGAVGAFLYRLCVLYREGAPDTDRQSARPWLWLLEWPVARVLGLSWALVGNFDSCFAVLKRDLMNMKLSAMTLLGRSLRGALGMVPVTAAEPQLLRWEPLPEGELTPPVMGGVTAEPDSLGLINASLPLFSRALLLWLCVLAVISLAI